MRRTKRWLLGLGGMLFLTTITYFVQVYITAQREGEAPQYFGSPASQQGTLLKLTLVVIVMLIGIISNYIFEKAKTAPGDIINLRDELVSMMSSSKFIMALVISPLTFNSIFLVIGDNPQNIGDYLLAFQNGFFWQSIVSGIVKTHEATSPASASSS